MSQADQFSSPSMNAPPPKKGKSAIWIIGIVLAVLAAVGCLCCGGMTVLGKFGMDFLGQQVGVAAGRDSIVQEHIGTIESCTVNFQKSGEYAKRKPGHNAFDVKGSKGTGTLVVLTQQVGNEVSIVSGELILPNGDTHPLNAGGK